MRSTTAGSSTEAVDRRRHGLLLGVLMEFVKAVQDSRQREANRLLACYPQTDTQHQPKAKTPDL